MKIVTGGVVSRNDLKLLPALSRVGFAESEQLSTDLFAQSVSVTKEGGGHTRRGGRHLIATLQSSCSVPWTARLRRTTRAKKRRTARLLRGTPRRRRASPRWKRSSREQIEGQRVRRATRRTLQRRTPRRHLRRVLRRLKRSSSSRVSASPRRRATPTALAPWRHVALRRFRSSSSAPPRGCVFVSVSWRTLERRALGRRTIATMRLVSCRTSQTNLPPPKWRSRRLVRRPSYSAQPPK